MSRSAKSTPATLDPSIHAALLRTASGWRVVIAGAAAEGAGPFRLSESAELPDDGPRLRTYLNERKVGRIFIIIPASHAILRVCHIPSGSEDQLRDALSLQLETLPGDPLPEHRIAAGALPTLQSESGRLGILAAWPLTSAEEAPELDAPVTFVPEAAALIALASWSPQIVEAGVDASRPLLSVDPAGGEIAIILRVGDALRIRGVREPVSAESDFRRSLSKVVRETALTLGSPSEAADRLAADASTALAATGDTEQGIILPDACAERILSKIDRGGDHAWLRRFGLLVGALKISATSLAPLAELRDRVETPRPNFTTRTALWLSRPSTAARAVAALALLILLGPLAATWARLQILSYRFPDVSTDRRKVDDVRLRLAMYETLGEEAWSMTKALGDLATNAPRGIEVESIQLTTGDRSFRLRGRALNQDGEEAPQIVRRMEENFNATGMFSGITIGLGNRDFTGSYEFELNGKFPTAIAPFRTVRYPMERDFGRWTLADRISGRPAPADEAPRVTAPSSDSPAPAPVDQTDDRRVADQAPDTPSEARVDAQPDEAAAQSGREPTRRPAFGGGDPGIGTIADGSRTPQVNPNLIPEPITQDQVDSMSPEELQRQLAAVAQAQQRSEVQRDEALIERLNAEFAMLIARLRQLRAQGAGGSNR